MRRSETLDWMGIAASMTALGIESSAVIALRLAQAAAGSPRAAKEACRMWSEKIIALGELQTRFFAGELGTSPSSAAKTTLKHYRRKVAANRRRLMKSE